MKMEPIKGARVINLIRDAWDGCKPGEREIWGKCVRESLLQRLKHRQRQQLKRYFRDITKTRQVRGLSRSHPYSSITCNIDAFDSSGDRYNPPRFSGRIDEGVAHVIKEMLNHPHITPIMSCAGHDDTIWAKPYYQLLIDNSDLYEEALIYLRKAFKPTPGTYIYNNKTGENIPILTITCPSTRDRNKCNQVLLNFLRITK
jgi:hypothetical protein